jgi:hypothetical protein
MTDPVSLRAVLLLLLLQPSSLRLLLALLLRVRSAGLTRADERREVVRPRDGRSRQEFRRCGIPVQRDQRHEEQQAPPRQVPPHKPDLAATAHVRHGHRVRAFVVLHGPRGMWTL